MHLFASIHIKVKLTFAFTTKCKTLFSITMNFYTHFCVIIIRCKVQREKKVLYFWTFLISGINHSFPPIIRYKIMNT